MRALAFDWDGVFNTGEKSRESSSGFTEADSMGVNMLRYALWRRDGRLPGAAIITGEPNASAGFFAEREHFCALYQQIKDKRSALADYCRRQGIEPAQVVCVFDDINDIAMAMDCGARILVRRDASAMLRDYLSRNAHCDYITSSASGRYAVRETAELIMGLTGLLDETVGSRVAFDDDYQAYLAARQAVEVEVISAADLR